MEIETHSSELPWPTKGDKLIRSDTQGWDLACLYPKKFITYAIGYKEAADAVIKDARQRQVSADFIAFPAIYLYRHYIELMLKAIIIKGQILGGDSVDVPASHDLMFLWNKSKQIIKEHIPSDEVSDIVEGHIKEFSRLDNDSQESRYPVNSKGDISLEGCDKLDVRNFSEVMDKMGSYLGGTFDILDEYINNLQ